MDNNNTLGLRDGLKYTSDKYTPKYACMVSDRKTKTVGEWVYVHTLAGMRYYRCNHCDDMETLADENEVKWWRFCPRCGSKMFTKNDKGE